MTPSASPRLRCLRGPVALSAQVRPAARSGASASFSNIVNLSGSGCLLRTSEAPSEGDRLEVHFALPGSKEVHAVGRVARIGRGANAGDFLVGLAFEALGDRDSELIARHVVQQGLRRRAV